MPAKSTTKPAPTPSIYPPRRPKRPRRMGFDLERGEAADLAILTGLRPNYIRRVAAGKHFTPALDKARLIALEKGWTVHELAYRCGVVPPPPRLPKTVDKSKISRSKISRDTGINLAHVSRIVSGQQSASLGTFGKLAAYFNTTIDHLLSVFGTKLGTPPMPVVGYKDGIKKGHPSSSVTRGAVRRAAEMKRKAGLANMRAAARRRFAR